MNVRPLCFVWLAGLFFAPAPAGCATLIGSEDYEQAACEPQSLESCYDGPRETGGVGACRSGFRMCNPEGTGYGECLHQVTPATENLLTEIDEDCDGQGND